MTTPRPPRGTVHTHTHSLSLTHTLTLTHARAHTHTRMMTHTRTHTHTHEIFIHIRGMDTLEQTHRIMHTQTHCMSTHKHTRTRDCLLESTPVLLLIFILSFYYCTHTNISAHTNTSAHILFMFTLLIFILSVH